MVKVQIALQPARLVVPSSLAEPRLREAGLAWLDMALELFEQEVFSLVKLDWWRTMDGTENQLLLSLDSSKNFRTRQLQDMTGAPPEVFKRRERFDDAVKKLLSRAQPEDLWAALVNQSLFTVDCWYIQEAWGHKTVGTSLERTYPRFSDSREFLFHLMQVRKLPPHPWA
jgi:hypothetical protein